MGATAKRGLYSKCESQRRRREEYKLTYMVDAERNWEREQTGMMRVD